MPPAKQEQQQERIAQLKEMNLSYDGQYYFGTCEMTRDINIHWTEILCDSEEEWCSKIMKIKQELLNRKA